MLQSLAIKNFALIEQIHVDWTRGLNVLTGETGAGKSILIDAINILLGGKASASLIRAGADKIQIEGVFRPTPSAQLWLQEQELCDPESNELLISREINKSGSRFRINGALVNQALMQELRQFLVNIHAQHEASTLISSQAQLIMLDALGDKKHEALLESLASIHAQKKELDIKQKDFHLSEEERLKRLDFARFQLNELNEANLSEANEDETLVKQQRVLANVVILASYAASAQKALMGGLGAGEDDAASVPAIDSLQLSLSDIERGSKLDLSLDPVACLLKTSLANLEEASAALRRYSEALDTDPETLALVEGRIAELATIKRKYGPTLNEALERREKLEQEIEKLENNQIQLDDLTKSLLLLQEKLSSLAEDLSKRRSILAKKLGERVELELADLGMERCRFEIRVDRLDDVGHSGFDRIEFVISPNPGQPLMPLAKIASGGELSRIMLVVKSIFAEADQVSTVIFDEIDTGLSGKVLQAMRDKLAHLAKSHQVLCITHQPIIAAVADNHLQIEKTQSEQTTKVFTKVLLDQERLKTLAAMASGQENEEVAINFAKSLVSQANLIKSGITQHK
jgi:DNA repair protein RecN (Recombination protein N)